MSKSKARGADSWTPPELQALPDLWLLSLAEFMERWEAQGSWPDSIRHSIIALVPKEGAQHEKGLRPIGILSYVYRLWMALRRATVKP